MREIKGVKLLITIVDRDVSKKIGPAFKKLGCKEYQVVLGYGTAPKEALNLLGIGVYKKDVIFCLINAEDRDKYFELLNNKFHFDKAGKGIAITIPVSSIDSVSTLMELI